MITYENVLLDNTPEELRQVRIDFIEKSINNGLVNIQGSFREVCREMKNIFLKPSQNTSENFFRERTSYFSVEHDDVEYGLKAVHKNILALEYNNLHRALNLFTNAPKNEDKMNNISSDLRYIATKKYLSLCEYEDVSIYYLASDENEVFYLHKYSKYLQCEVIIGKVELFNTLPVIYIFDNELEIANKEVSKSLLSIPKRKSKKRAKR